MKNKIKLSFFCHNTLTALSSVEKKFSPVLFQTPWKSLAFPINYHC